MSCASPSSPRSSKLAACAADRSAAPRAPARPRLPPLPRRRPRRARRPGGHPAAARPSARGPAGVAAVVPSAPGFTGTDGDRRHAGLVDRRGVAQRRRAARSTLGRGPGRQRGGPGRAGGAQGRAGGAALPARAAGRAGDASPRVQGHAVHPARTPGIFRQQSGGDWYVFTQFEETDARRAFPCVDEPAAKIPWELTLRVPADAHRACPTPRWRARPPTAEGIKDGPVPADAAAALVSGGVRGGPVRDQGGAGRGQEAGAGPHHRPARARRSRRRGPPG